MNEKEEIVRKSFEAGRESMREEVLEMLDEIIETPSTQPTDFPDGMDIGFKDEALGAKKCASWMWKNLEGEGFGSKISLPHDSGVY